MGSDVTHRTNRQSIPTNDLKWRNNANRIQEKEIEITWNLPAEDKSDTNVIKYNIWWENS